MNHLDPVNVMVVAVAAYIGSGQAAEIIGPYSVIFLMAVLGSLWSLGSASKDLPLGSDGKPQELPITKALFQFCLIVSTAVISTYYLTQAVMALDNITVHMLEDTSVPWIMGLISFVIGCVGTRWKRVGAVIFKAVLVRILNFIGGVK